MTGLKEVVSSIREMTKELSKINRNLDKVHDDLRDIYIFLEKPKQVEVSEDSKALNEVFQSLNDSINNFEEMLKEIRK